MHRGTASLQREQRIPPTDARKAQAFSARAFVVLPEFNSYCAVIVTLPVAADFTKFASPL